MGPILGPILGPFLALPGPVFRGPGAGRPGPGFPGPAPGPAPGPSPGRAGRGAPRGVPGGVLGGSRGDPGTGPGGTLRSRGTGPTGSADWGCQSSGAVRGLPSWCSLERCVCACGPTVLAPTHACVAMPRQQSVPTRRRGRLQGQRPTGRGNSLCRSEGWWSQDPTTHQLAVTCATRNVASGLGGTLFCSADDARYTLSAAE